MATINLYHGGKSIANPGYTIYPRPALVDDGDASFDRVSAHKAPAAFGLTRELNFCDCAVQDGITNVNGSSELVAGDIFVMSVVPARMNAQSLYYEVTSIAAGVTFDIVTIDASAVVTAVSGVLDGGTPILGQFGLTDGVDVNPLGYGIRIVAVPAAAACGDISFAIHLGIDVLDLAPASVMLDSVAVSETAPV